MNFIPKELTTEQWQQVDTLAASLTPDQAVWISGYFAGLGHQARLANSGAEVPVGFPAVPTKPAPVAPATRTLTVLFGSETGNSASLARTLADAVRRKGIDPILVDMADYKVRRLKDERDLIVIVSTHGEGDPPLSAKPFFEFLESRKAPRLTDVKYAVLALGDSTYEHYCAAGKRLDHRLEELGGKRIGTRVDCDVDYEDDAAAWIAAIAATLRTSSSSPLPFAPASTAEPAVPRADGHDKRNPFPAAVIENIVLTGRGSSKETRHVELSLAGSGLVFEPGDALGFLPHNDPALVDALLRQLSLSPDAPVVVKDRSLALGEALSSMYEITTATPRFIEHWAELSGASELAALNGEGAAAVRASFLRDHHVIDIARRFSVGDIDPQTLLAALRPIQPRLYSIASSLSLLPDEIHLTVSTVRYELHGEPRTGIASGQIAFRTGPDTTLPIYVQSNPHFRLPSGNDVPIVMIGAGTGVAPYRSFLQEREARGATGRSWLFFGERNFHTDFLYQTEWQSWLGDGVLRRLNVAFSRDQAGKVYVQHRLREHGRDVYAWLEEGGHVYVCGDATNLAPDVHAALSDVVQQERGCSRAAAQDYLSLLQRDHRYQIDVY
jgi:sulfite reductase (NADPH) flavoprotein alpha-component